MPDRGFIYPILCLLVLPSINAECIQNIGCQEEKTEKNKDTCNVYRQDFGAPIPSYTVSRTCGKHGPITIDDVTYFKLLAAYERERIPNRQVHAKGAGAFGYFEVTHDITEYTKAAVFSKKGLKTPMACRFSLSTGETGTPDTARSRTGFACRFYTTEGNWDIVGQTIPVFFVKDPILYVSFIHVQQLNPVTGRNDPNSTWDFYSKRNEALTGIIYNFSDLGTTYGYRYMDGYGVNAFVFVNKHNHPTYVKFTWKSGQGIRNFTSEEAKKMAGEEPDFATKDLYDAIEAGDYPYWTLCIQVMDFEEAKHVDFDPLDATVLWPEEEFPLKPVGKMYLNKNPKSFFADVEMAGYSVSTLPPGIQPSNDRLLQGRMFAYDDAQRYRLGVNSHQLYVNSPQGVPCCPKTINRDGFMNINDDLEGRPVYYPTSFSHLHVDPKADYISYRVDDTIDRHDLGSDPNYKQAKKVYHSFSQRDRDHLAKNVADNIKDILKPIQCKILKLFEGVSEKLSEKIAHYGKIHCSREYED